MFICQGDDSLIFMAVKAAVADKMKGVPGAGTHGFLQITPSLTRQPGELQETFILEILDCCFNALPFPRNTSNGGRSAGEAVIAKIRRGGVTVNLGMGWGNSRYRMDWVFRERQRYSPWRSS